MSSTPVIKCDSVYKIFGANAEKMLQNANGNLDAKKFQDEGCIVGVIMLHLKFQREQCL